MTIIPIIQQDVTVPHPNTPPSHTQARRRFLQGSGLLFGTLAAGSLLAQLAPTRSWALELFTLSGNEGQTLMRMGRTLYPHDKLPDAVYALLAKDLDARAKADAAITQQLHEGLAKLNTAAGGNFSEANAERQLAAVTALQDTPFFATVQGQCITSLYDNDMAWAVFGYEGSSFEHGGYLRRGFQDLQWLPDPDAADSPAPFAG